MDIQSTLTLAIEVIVMSFVTLMIADFVNGLLVVPASISTASVFETLPSFEQLEVKPQVTPQVEEVPDPWELVEIQESEIATVEEPSLSSVLTLRLLPPAQETKPQPKRRGRPNKSADQQKPAPATTTTTPTKRKPGRPRKVA
jgi:hypothetical protein